jgi:hypothetical protein
MPATSSAAIGALRCGSLTSTLLYFGAQFHLSEFHIEEETCRPREPANDRSACLRQLGRQVRERGWRGARGLRCRLSSSARFLSLSTLGIGTCSGLWTIETLPRGIEPNEPRMRIRIAGMAIRMEFLRTAAIRTPKFVSGCRGADPKLLVRIYEIVHGHNPIEGRGAPRN